MITSPMLALTMVTDISLLNKLKSAIQKIKFLLSFNATRWFVSSIRSPVTPRRISFNRQPSLLDCTNDYSSTSTLDDLYEWVSNSTGMSRSTSIASPVSRTSIASPVSRTSSIASPSDDIDKRADIFIANFYKHIQMERQVSLELLYCQDNSSYERIASF